jgi:hypothetical protein
MKSATKNRITTSGTITAIAESVAITQVFVAVANAGTSWSLRIQDKGTPVFVLLPTTVLSAPALASWNKVFFDDPIKMDGGIDIVTSGTPGEVSVWINFEKGGG